MAWVKLDDQFFINQKVRSAGPSGQLLYLAGLCWCAMQLNDGHINGLDLPAIAGLAVVEPDIADHLVSVGLWERTDGGFRVPDYLTFNPSREQTLAERAAGAERQRRSRERSRRDSRRDSQGTNGVSNGVSSGDPSRPVPRDISHSSSGNSRDAGHPVDDGQISTGDVPEETWNAYAEIRLRAEGNVRNPVPWKRTCVRNAKTELGEQAATWWAMFDLTPRRLAECLADGQAPRNVPRREPA